MHYLDFETSIADLDAAIETLQADLSEGRREAIDAEIERLNKQKQRQLKSMYSGLTAWRKCQVARHPDRPHCSNYIDNLFTEVTALAGDRGYSEDQAVRSVLARFRDRPVIVIGHEKGRDTRSRLHHNFGMARPEGYRKATRLMKLADRFGLPLITLVDTPGAYPGLGAEQRGQAEAIARTIEASIRVRIPIVSVIVGEGGSGGAVAFATADRTAMLEHSVYSVISPEGCASILWKDAGMMQLAADALRLTAQDMKRLGVIDRILPEPLGGAQRDHKQSIETVGNAIAEMLEETSGMSRKQLVKARRRKFTDMFAA
ncbi:MAG: acetyl-CoA carboxylase carboxyltransferase subunit alpha [Rhodobacteraceae bacterium]|nr:acetyl-CoA carboxylase carboxyltransferase subunit alpha [Paracoccaceae bacterium]